jgi:putative membrane protein
MQWWCAATTAEWSWTWRAYPGVWILVGLILFWYLRKVGRLRTAGISIGMRAIWFGLGTLVLWIALDWPVGALGAGYLLSVHTAQYVALSLIAMPLLLAGCPPELYPGPSPGRTGGVLSVAARPAAGLLGYTAVMAVTHVPRITDALMATQFGSLLIDLAWLAGAFLLWWPVFAPEGFSRMSSPLKIGYLFLATIPPTVPAAFMVFADYPLYALYELAPRAGLTAGTDQQAAGLIMKAGADPLLWLAMTIVFFRWQRAESDAERRDRAPRLEEQPT